MLFGSASPTPYDLRFSAFGIPVRVHPLFWAFSAAMGWNRDLGRTFIWVACVFVSVLVHELGHALTARFFRWHSEIVLYIFGGYASYVPTWHHSAGRAILVTAAGPGAGFLLLALVFGLDVLLGLQGIEIPDHLYYAFRNLEFINLSWGLLNLLPVIPLDGGQIAKAALSHFWPYQGAEYALKLSLATAIGIIVLALRFEMTMVAIWFGTFAFANFEALRTGSRFF
jgi:Zn-dependent protease